MRPFRLRMFVKHARLLLPLFLLIIGLVAQAQTATEIPGQTLAQIKVRGGAGTEYPELATLPFNSQIIIEARNNIGNWFIIRQDDLGVRGWVASRYISWADTETPLANIAVLNEVISDVAAAPVGEEAAPVGGSVVTNTDATPLPTGTLAVITIEGTPARTLARVNLRNAADFNGGIITIVRYDVNVTIQGRNARGNWLLVQTEDGLRGWIAARYLTWDAAKELASFAVSSEVIGQDQPLPLLADAATVIPPSGSLATAAVPTQAADGSITGSVLVANLNIRAAADETSRQLAQARMEAVVYIEARNRIGDWLLIRTAGEPSYRGWVASRFIGWSDTIPLANIRVSDEIMGDRP